MTLDVEVDAMASAGAGRVWMKAVVQHRYGPPDVLRIEEVERPTPRVDEVLIHVRATTVSQSDTHARGAHPFAWRFVAGLRRPRWRWLGVEFAGVVEAVGGAVTEFHIGDEVFGQPARFFGAHAEYIVLPESAPVTAKPANLSFEEAAAVGDGSSQALDALRRAKVGPGSRIAIYGASGSLGTAAVQIAKHLGANVTGVCGPTHLDLVRSLGADEVVDYTQEDFRGAGAVFDAVIDAVGKYAFVRARRALKSGGIYVATDAGPYLESLLMAVPSRFAGSRRLVFAVGRRRKEDLVFMRELIESGAYRPVVDRRYPLDQVVEAHRRVETWHKTGNVVLVMP
jgi:NADPH:quinone reductase-like Zn-dependent oxidoreductase